MTTEFGGYAQDGDWRVSGDGLECGFTVFCTNTPMYTKFLLALTS